MDLSPDEEHFQGRLLHQAALWDNVELLQELLVNGADVNAQDGNGRTALHAASLCERSRCLAALCAAGATLDLQCDAATGGKTALHIAAERGHVENVRSLLEAGASLHLLDSAGETALALAERNCHRHAAMALKEAADALERERLSAHAQLRELVQSEEPNQLKSKLQALGNSAEIVVNLTPNGANTLLYVAAEAGLEPAVEALLSAGADGRAHAATRYSPLYIAAYQGHTGIAKLLLSHFPYAVQQETVEKRLPLHAATISGYVDVVKLLLDFNYPEAVYSTYTDPTGAWQYRAPFDINARDALDQTALYIACLLGDLPVVDALLKHTVPCARVSGEQVESDAMKSSQVETVVSPQRGISLGIHAIVSKLTGSNKESVSPARAHRIRPVRVEEHRAGDSCAAGAVRGGHARVLSRLLAAGASADAPATPPFQAADARGRSRSAPPRAAARPASPAGNEGWTALTLAAHLGNMTLVEMLVRHGASDPHCRALRECVRLGRGDLLPALLATKAYPDPDYKLNKSALSESVFSSRDGDKSLTYNAMCPTTPVMVNWSDLKCQMTLIRYLNAAQNKLERLPSFWDAFVQDVDVKGWQTKRAKKGRLEIYSAPVLQEIFLQDNRLEQLPPELFQLRALSSLDVSNNKLRALPAAMWRAPALAHLHAAFNHLRGLPAQVEDEADLASPTSGDNSTDSQQTSPAVRSKPPVRKSVPRSTSAARADSDVNGDDEVAVLGDRSGNTVWSAAARAHPWRAAAEGDPAEDPGGPAGGAGGGSPLTTLNLAHNQLTCVPPALACLAPALTRLNLAYNSLRTMSYVTSYPKSLRQLDLSHNEITCWPSLPQIENLGSGEGDPLACYCGRGGRQGGHAGGTGVAGGHVGGAGGHEGGSTRAQLLSAACPARRHLRLESLRTLILANNLLTRIQLTTDDDGESPAPAPPAHPAGDEQDDEWADAGGPRARLVCPQLSMLDVSANLLRALPHNMHHLTNLAVLNISGNKDICELPPTMGLLSRLWSLSAAGCELREPLGSMLARTGAGGVKYRSIDVVSYLKSILQEAKPYTKMKLMLCGIQGIGKTSLLDCLRQESAIQHRRKPTDHWAKRMGNKTRRGGNLSTVGVDIGTWTYEKQRSSRGPVTFRTWDFGGQQEYYATHQYFLSRRSLYLVVWRVTAGRAGLAGAVDWLRSIQARAPGAPVIMVATHYDQVANCDLPESESPETLQRLIRSCIMGCADADKLGLPRVMDSVEVSCSTRHNIRLLADIIYSVAFSVKPPGSKEPLLEQLVPATYLALEECVTSLAAELQEPVLRHHEFKQLVTQYMTQKNHRKFRDAAELHQATMFLHENGVLIHYDDANLKELYFLRPQWLCDVLAHVVTVREINPFAANGIMKVEDLAHVFKASPQLSRGEETSSLGVSLLNKFELALCWDGRVLLVPSLLPAREPAAPQLPMCARTAPPSWPPRPGPESPTLIQVSGRAGAALRRLLLLSYVPRGWWARLCTRLPADTSLRHAAGALYSPPPDMELDETVTKALAFNWAWKLWRTGLKLVCGDLTLVLIRELPARRDALLGALAGAGGDDGADDDPDTDDNVYKNLRLRVKQEGVWCSLDVQSSACIEILLPAAVCCVRRADHSPIGRYQSISLEPNQEALTKVLALVADHVDLLLEDWYPSLGTRFVHTSEGRCLITRLVPCPACLKDLQPPADHDHDLDRDHMAQAFRHLELGAGEQRLRLSAGSRASDGDSGVDAESNASSRAGSVEGAGGVRGARGARASFAWTVEECVLCACTGAALACPRHAAALRDVAPDTLLLDVPAESRAEWAHVRAARECGRGAGGAVLAAEWRRPPAGPRPVAVKALQPVPPPAGDAAALHAYKAALSRWERDPLAAACRAYCGLRQELSVLTRLQHPHVIPLLGVCGTPLALLLPLAPQGALEGVLREYRGCGARVGVRAARALALQAARALEYLHARRVVYRDLKSENVLVWAMPRAQDAARAERSAAPPEVHIKLADYGISRLAPPSGTKGFGGTEGFMAPEIIRYNGEEEYTEKVDCFSYGMLLYEIMTLRQPFEGHEAVKEAILEGARPTLDARALRYPCALLACMRRCWAAGPARRPAAAALACVCAAPELAALQDAAGARAAATAAAVPLHAASDEDGSWEVWYTDEPERVHTLITTSHAFTHQHTIRIPPDKSEPVTVTAICRVGNKMWLGDSAGILTVYSVSTCAPVWRTRLSEAVGGTGTGAGDGDGAGISALQPLAALQRVAVALQCGRLFLVTSCLEEAAAGSFVLTELGAASGLACLTAVHTPQGWEVWAGGDALYAYALRGGEAGGVRAAHTLGAARVALLAAPAHARAAPHVVSYSRPGTCVCAWSVQARRPEARLDCSKLAPCSESLQADDRRDGQVTALCCVGGSVLVGTAGGCLIVCEADSLRPLTVFRPHVEQLRAIVPLPPHLGGEEGGELMVATLGVGYRPLVDRFAPPQANNCDAIYSGPFCLLWHTRRWLPE